MACLLSWAYARESFGYQTERGVGFRTTRSRVLETYGEPVARTLPRLGQTRLIYDQMGIAFTFDGESMWEFRVFRPGTAKQLFKF